MAKAISSTQSLFANVTDASSLFGAVDAINERFPQRDSRKNLDYTALANCLARIREDANWNKAALNSIVISIDPNSEGQIRFESMLTHSGFETDRVFFRDAFVSLPPGLSPRDSSYDSLISLAPRISYVAGLMGRYDRPELLVVSHAFELCGPLTDLARRKPNGRVGIAYFGSLMDYRWRMAGLMEGDLNIEFFDLDEFGREIFGVDLKHQNARGNDDAGRGLSRF